MERSKIVAIITGAISILLAIAYLVLVQLLDYRDMKPAPISQLISQQVVASIYSWGLGTGDWVKTRIVYQFYYPFMS
ncbi:hypothetical protein [Nodularia chucula]|uniref:hypothetical protein n=1 Tax=Nodularia chucula TaxID=3093667 RepID=UPI0039C60863